MRGEGTGDELNEGRRHTTRGVWRREISGGCLEPALLVLYVGSYKFFIRLCKVNDAFDDPYD
jgi:hypothetical protein